MRIARSALERGVDVEAGTETAVGGSGGVTPWVRSGATTSIIIDLIRFVGIVELRSVRRVDDVKIEEGVSLNKVGTLMNWSVCGLSINNRIFHRWKKSSSTF